MQSTIDFKSPALLLRCFAYLHERLALMRNVKRVGLLPIFVRWRVQVFVSWVEPLTCSYYRQGLSELRQAWELLVGQLQDSACLLNLKVGRLLLHLSFLLPWLWAFWRLVNPWDVVAMLLYLVSYPGWDFSFFSISNLRKHTQIVPFALLLGEGWPDFVLFTALLVGSLGATFAIHVLKVYRASWRERRNWLCPTWTISILDNRGIILYVWERAVAFFRITDWSIVKLFHFLHA